MKTNRYFLNQLSAIGLALFLILIMTQCKKESDDGAEETSKGFVMSSDARYISDNDWQSMVQSVDSSDFTLTFDKNIIANNNLKQGNLLVSSIGNGLLRKIDGIINDGNSVRIKTSQATLSDLVMQGDIDFRSTLSVAKIKNITYYYPGVFFDTTGQKSTNGEVFNWEFNTEIYPQILLQGNFKYSSDFIFQLQMNLLQGVKKVKFGFEASEEFHLSLMAGKQFSFEKDILLAKVNFTPFFVPLPTPPFTIVVVPVLDIKIGAKGYANANIETHLAQNIIVETGIQYIKDEGWDNYANYDKSFDFVPPQINLNAGAEAYIKPELTMLIFNLVGPFINAKGYGRIEADLIQTPWWSMYYGVKMSGGVNAEILGNTLFDFTVEDLLTWEKQVGQSTGSNMPPSPPSNPNPDDNATGISAQTSLSWTCSDPDMDPLTYDVYFGTNNPPTLAYSDVSNTTLTINTLSSGQVYYWKVVAKDNQGNSTSGNIWAFATSDGGPLGEPCPGIPIITDPRDGQVYPTVQIGSQCWLQKNMNYQTGNSWCYDDDPSNCSTYGRLYDWESALNVCPTGWHLPSDAEWAALITFLGDDYFAGGKLKEVGTTHWLSPNKGATNTSGFTALPGGIRYAIDGGYAEIGEVAQFWSSTTSSSSAWLRFLHYQSTIMERSDVWDRADGFSARCLQD